jgi:group I intron endonuclease
MNKIFTIYRATNVENGKVYVGFDSDWPKRKNDHLKYSRTNKRCGHFNRAIKKHGEEKFVWDVLYQSSDGDHCLNTMENHFILENNSFGSSGYNMTLGGDGRLGSKTSPETLRKLSLALKNPSDETRLKMSLAQRGKTHTEETRLKISLGHTGLKHSDEAKRKMSLAKLGKPRKKKTINE